MIPKPIEAYINNRKVWVSPLLDNLRREESLCVSCKNFQPKKPTNCKIAQSFQEICISETVALAVTMCPLWESKSTSPA